MVICAAGLAHKFLKEFGIAESMRNVMIDDGLGQRFQNKKMVLLGGILDKEKVRPKHFEIIKSNGRKIKKYHS